MRKMQCAFYNKKNAPCHLFLPAAQRLGLIEVLVVVVGVVGGTVFEFLLSGLIVGGVRGTFFQFSLLLFGRRFSANDCLIGQF